METLPIAFIFTALLVAPGYWGLPFSRVEHETTTCGYSACTGSVPGMLNVHLIPHSHDDVGWLKTVDQYYYGKFSNIQSAGVQYIIDTVLQEVATDPSKRFIQVETAFFWKWWVEQDEDTRDLYRSLVNSGQIEMIGGGWSMNDEAATHYHSTIDNFAWGLRRLDEAFGACGRPRVGWQIDPFGHSRETASIMAQMGFDGLLFARLDYQDKEARVNTSTMEMLWEASANLGSSADLFTSVMYSFYGSPAGFCYDVECNDEPIIDNVHSTEYNVDNRVKDFLSYVNDHASHYVTDNILIPMGGDFQYQDAHINYKNMDKLIRYVNALQANGSRVNVLYSTPSCYLKGLNDAKQTWATKDDDFFPYASSPNDYWTGYFTSRPTIKRLERVGNNLLQVCKQLSVLGNVTEEDNLSKLDDMRDAMGVMQHHDAVTGTEKQAVADDYVRILTEAIIGCGDVTRTAINNLVGNNSNLELKSCLLLNISLCEETESSEDFLVTIYNPISHVVSQYVRLPVSGDSYTVTDYNGESVVSQLVPIPQSVLNIPYRNSSALNELVFRATDLPPLGFTSYHVTVSSSTGSSGTTRQSNDTNIGNTGISLEINATTGLVQSITNNGVSVAVQQEFLYYVGAEGNNTSSDTWASGAYIFRPDPQDSEPKRISEKVSTVIYKGDLVEEIHQVFSDWTSQVIRVYKEESHVELEWLVGPIPINDNKGKEPISRFTTNLSTNKIFYTDSNGREMLRRERNHRPTWDVKLAEPAPGNYYPVTSKIVVTDEDKGLEFAVLNDRAQGGASMKDGQIEVMVHRRLLNDDAKGVGEALNETAYGEGLIARGRHFVFAGEIAGSDNVSLAAQERLLAQRILLAPWVFISQGSSAQTRSINRKQFVGLTRPLPENVQVLTLEPQGSRTVLLRLEHILERNEDSQLSQDVTVALQDILVGLDITSVKEMTLDGNKELSSLERLSWSSTNTKERPVIARKIEDPFTITLNPFQIRTFLVGYQ